MKRDLSMLASRDYDLVIVGAGAFGSCVAWEAASHGLSVALLERKDFCNATSANHLKMVHGGIRYLQHADLYRVRESCRERSALLRIAPHLVRPIPILMPTYGHLMQGKEVLRLGMLVYDLLTCDRNRGVSDPARRIPRGRLISREECLEQFPGLKKEGLTGAGIFYDGQMYNPPRLALAFLRSAVTEGADMANYAEVTSFLRKSDHIVGVKVRDVLTDDEFEITGKIVINVSGPWADQLLKAGTGVQLNPTPTFSRDLGFVVSRRLNAQYGFACQIRTQDPDAILSRKGRHIFVMPWRDYTLVGVWHMVHTKGPDEVSFAEKELEAYIREINDTYPEFSLTLKDVSMVNAGLTLFGENEPDAANLSFGKRSLLVDHAKEHRLEGLITLIGVRATTARGEAEKAVNLVFKKLGKKLVKSKTTVTPIHGGRIESVEEFLRKAIEQHSRTCSPEVIRSLVHNYGAEYGQVLKYINENPTWAETVPGSSVIKAQVVYAVREEMAQKLGDVVSRRTDLGTGAYPGEDALRSCADVMGSELGWDEGQKEMEVREVMDSFPLK